MDPPQADHSDELSSPANSLQDDPPVIVGMACRLPGDITSPSRLWDFMVEQKSAQGPVPAQRYNIDGFYHPDGGNRSGMTNVPGGYFLNEDIRSFDNGFFGISNLEATYMDPQQRKLLEIVYECLEGAGVSMESLSGSNTGVFLANFSVDYQPMMFRDPDYVHRYVASGSGATIMSNRISHIFNLHGPSSTIDTACSSSIYALHQAVNAMKTNDCDSVIVASSNLIMSPEAHVAAAKSGVLSPTGTCHTFDVSADGYGRAEGVSAIYVKRLSAALRDGNPIRAVIRGSAVGASGKTAGISLPSGKQQEIVMRKAYDASGLDFAGTDYVECHGTGTPVGDPIEVDAVGRAFSPRGGSALLIGSVKTNVGHSEGASGLTSVLKVVKSFENGLIPPSRGVAKLNPKLILDERNIKVATKVEQWPRALRRASINSFGYGGANAHIILEAIESYLGQSQIYQDPTPASPSGDNDLQQLVVLPVSAASPKSLEARLEHLSRYVSQGQLGNNTNALQSLAHTLTKGRDHLRHRGFLLARQAASGSVEIANTDGKADAEKSRSASSLPFSFVFTGQGAQYSGMAKELLFQSQRFRNTVRKLDAVLKALPVPYAPSWTLEQTLLDNQGTSHINEVTRSQPICTAVQIGLVDLLRSWGVQPASVVGHSSGEIAAAYAAGLLNFKQAILVAYYRGYAVDELRSKGAMMAAGVSAETAKSLIESKGLDADVRVACINAPEGVTLSGTPDGIDKLKGEFESHSKFVRKLETGGRAYHSHMMEGIGGRYEKLLVPLFGEPLTSQSSDEVSMYSSVGRSPENLKLLDKHENMAAYWRHNLEQPVQFNAALTNLVKAADGKVHLIEIGPHAALKGPIQQIQKAIGLKDSAPYSSTLVRNQDADTCIKTLAGTLFTYSHTLNWTGVDGLPESGLKTIHDLPSYQWDYSNGLLWNEPRPSVEMRNRKYVRHELLGTIALTGNGIDHTWRNIVKPSEMPWIKDHKLEDQVVFPATGYMALAIEAVSQVTGAKTKNLSELGFEFRNVQVSAAFIIPDENDAAAKDLELHTTMSLRKISNARTSVDWHDFSVSSWKAGQTTLHCAGSVRVTEPVAKTDSKSVTIQDAEGFDVGPSDRWYKKWHKEGLCFGPQFQSLTSSRTDGGRSRNEVIATVALQPPNVDSTTHYPVHPITIDACLQAAIWSTAAGHLPALKAWLPVFISEARIQSVQQQEEAEVHARSQVTGFSSRTMDATIRNGRGAPVVDIRGARIALFSGKSQMANEADAGGQSDLYLQRQPTLRVNWKPDVLRLSPETEQPLRDYIADFVSQQHPDIRDDESLAVIGGLVDLAGHKNPRMRVLELGGDCHGYKAHQWKGILDGETAFSRCRSWDTAELGEDGEPLVENGGEAFDVLLIPKHATSKQIWTQAPPERIASLVSDHGIVITRKSEAAKDVLETVGLDVLDVGKQVLLAVRPVQTESLKGRKAIIVHNEKPSPAVTSFANTLTTYLQKRAGVSQESIITISQIGTGNLDIHEKDICISLLEMEREFLATISPQNMDRLRTITDKANDLVWLTGANMLGAHPDANLTLSNGLSRALMLEQPTLRYSILDVGPAQFLGSNVLATCANVVKVLVARYDKDDCEFIDANSLLYISRYGPDFSVNSLFRRRLEPQAAMEKQTIESASPARLAIGQLGVTDTLHFQQLSGPEQFGNPPAGHVDIEVKAVSLNAKDVYAINGRVDTRDKTNAFDFAGVVRTVGPEVQHLQVGDRAVAYAPHHFGTSVRVPAGSAHKMLDSEEFTVVPTLLLVYGTALYALNDRAHLRAGESIFIHAGSGGLGIAAITLAQRIGATVYTTVGSEAKREYLIQKLGIKPSHIFSSRDASFVEGIMEATGGRGVDVVLNSLVGDLMHDSWRCLADFGRFIEVGKRELIDAGKLDMRIFLRNATFSAFDLSELFYATDPYNRAIWDRLMAETLELYRAGEIQPPPIKVFDVTEVAQAYRYFASKERVGKVVISLKNPQARVPVAPARYLSVFSSEKVYLLVGCLGGLGRSLSRWMMTRGARHFVFLGRSGADKPSAQQLVSRLEKAGATVGVVRGDVSQATDVNAAVAACVATGRQVGGVIQAAMGLHEALFTRMTNKAWHTGIDPKWQGTWNLHNALALDGQDAGLDFFLMTSSVSGTVGTATESNYCSANGFLDAFARWRRSQGKPAVSVGLGMISEVGYLHENPNIEALLLRKGIQPLNEDEMLQVIDLALASEAAHDPKEAHLLTGLEPAGIRELSAQGFDVSTHGVLTEGRAAVLLASLQAAEESRGARVGNAGARQGAIVAAAPWFKELPAGLTGTFAPEADAESLQAAILRLVKRRFSSLILMPFDQLDDRKPMPDFGVDSMIASEFRSWFWSAFRVDVPFLDIMSAQKSLISLVDSVEGKITAS
ncbi:polyketide synthase [Pseudomassariella vexata]|uniref:Polyketide synthase n=1 Tax=Pseudomassariella vexata TaxID=1141098 RepID=A0A1Y2EJT3_9PEZI|nr:polyketide synthase [Pseudomassariella vexata]ORY71075.1 polyketide synthase [Pseudomassariella vexata]